ncbi:hypothetical protein [Kistimonas asteriae]|uniref:hypothetical protein n=1 Tax=Kistimonas asteriae TaxID=517724 RepID=UPI001BAE198A|nr:hypothetical protein [Kistimonas asteriae]
MDVGRSGSLDESALRQLKALAADKTINDDSLIRLKGDQVLSGERKAHFFGRILYFITHPVKRLTVSYEQYLSMKDERESQRLMEAMHSSGSDIQKMLLSNRKVINREVAKSYITLIGYEDRLQKYRSGGNVASKDDTSSKVSAGLRALVSESKTDRVNHRMTMESDQGTGLFERSLSRDPETGISLSDKPLDPEDISNLLFQKIKENIIPDGLDGFRYIEECRAREVSKYLDNPVVYHAVDRQFRIKSLTVFLLSEIGSGSISEQSIPDVIRNLFHKVEPEYEDRALLVLAIIDVARLLYILVGVDRHPDDIRKILGEE